MTILDKVYYKEGLLYRKYDSGKFKKDSQMGHYNNGYVIVWDGDKRLRAHRVIWKMFNGAIPEGKEIDHINRVRDDNRIENLRLVDRTHNNLNTKLRVDNTSGYKGVCFDKRRGLWYTQFNSKFVGYSNCPTSAHIKYIEAKKEFMNDCSSD